MFFIVCIFIYMILLGMNDGGVYMENDFLKYYMFIDFDILNSFKVFEKYYFEYYSGDGYLFLNFIVFSEGIDVEFLKRYFLELGYKLYKCIFNKNEIVWESCCLINQLLLFYFLVNYIENSVQFEKEICYQQMIIFFRRIYYEFCIYG